MVFSLGFYLGIIFFNTLCFSKISFLVACSFHPLRTLAKSRAFLWFFAQLGNVPISSFVWFCCLLSLDYVWEILQATNMSSSFSEQSVPSIYFVSSNWNLVTNSFRSLASRFFPSMECTFFLYSLFASIKNLRWNFLLSFLYTPSFLLTFSRIVFVFNIFLVGCFLCKQRSGIDNEILFFSVHLSNHWQIAFYLIVCWMTVFSHIFYWSVRIASLVSSTSMIVFPSFFPSMDLPLPLAKCFFIQQSWYVEPLAGHFDLVSNSVVCCIGRFFNPFSVFWEYYICRFMFLAVSGIDWFFSIYWLVWDWCRRCCVQLF